MFLLFRDSSRSWGNREYGLGSYGLYIQAGAGGTESMDWAAMVLLMYKMWAQNHGFKVTIVDDVSSCFQVNDCDLRIERFRSGGPGG